MKTQKSSLIFLTISLTAILIIAVGCDSDSDSSSSEKPPPPSFSLAWSEYPSWSAFGVAHEMKLINGEKGKLGSIEKDWNVDIVLHEADYDSCITMYAASQSDAACLTNMDALNPALARPSVMILPTSTSVGADACITTDAINDVKDLRGKEIFGLEKTVSEYCFVRNLQILGEKEADYNFKNMDPGVAAMAMQQKQEGVEAIVVWNPFVMETLNKRSDCKVLFDSTSIPNEIIDAVIISQKSLQKKGGKAFACALIDAFYEINRRISDEATSDETLVALGEKFSHLDLESMKKVVEQTRFFSTGEAGTKMLTGTELPEIMKKVIEFCVSHEIIDRRPSIGYGSNGSGDLIFDESFINAVISKDRELP